ncbi:MAG: C25 family cysteine peptidase, partial [Bacteroidota bacterium]
MISNIIKTSLCVLISGIALLMCVTNAEAQNNYIDFDTTDNPTTSLPKETINNEGSNFVEIQYRFPGAFVTEKSVDDNLYNYINIEGFGKTGQVGKPALPAYHDILAIPENASPEISIIHSEYTEHTGFMIHPALEPAIDSDTIQPEFEMDSSLYNTNEFFPQNIVSINYIQKLRGIPLAFVRICPVQFNPVSNKIRVYSEIKYRVNFTGTETSFDDIATENSSDFIKTLKNLIKNPESVPDSESDSVSNRSNAKDYIIITHSDYDNAAAELAQWKQQLGYSVEIVSDNDWTSTEVKNEIHTRYHNWTPHPDYFVIIGDHEDVPGEIPFCASPEGDCTTDLYYACMDGPGDWVPDMAHGRISVSSSTEAINVVQKIIDYEKNPVNNVDFYSKGLHAAYFQDGQESPPADGYAERRFAQTSEDILNYMVTEQNFDTERVYYTENNVNPLYWNNGKYSAGEEIPAYLKKSGFAWDGDADDIKNEINAGALYVLHRDHGEIYNWGEPYFDKNDIESLSNVDKLPIVFSINCETGKYGKPECFAEKFLRKYPGGAIGVFAHMDLSMSEYNDALAIGLFDAIWSDPGLVVNFTGYGDDPGTITPHNDIYTMGDVANQGLIRMLETWGDNDNFAMNTHVMFHYFGDPAMKIWTNVPDDDLTASASPNLCYQYVSTDFQVNIDNLSDGDEAIVTLYKEDEMLEIVNVVGDNNNQATANFNDIVCNNTGDLYVTVSSHNYVPFEQIIPVLDFCDNFNSQSLIINNSQSWNNEKYLNRNIVIQNNSILNIYSTLFLQEDVEITVKDGSILFIRGGGKITKGCNDLWEGITDEDGGRIYVYGDCDYFNHLDVNQGGKMYYGSSGNIALNNNSSVLEITGDLHINSNATFTFTGDGYIKFSNPGGDATNNIFCGSGAS